MFGRPGGVPDKLRIRAAEKLVWYLHIDRNCLCQVKAAGGILPGICPTAAPGLLNPGCRYLISRRLHGHVYGMCHNLVETVSWRNLGKRG
jgi:hypothetical protein